MPLRHHHIYIQRKKDKDDGSNDTLSGDTKQLQGKTEKDEHMPASVEITLILWVDRFNLYETHIIFS